MKRVVMLVIVALFLVGCEYAYKSPLTKEHSISVDSAVLGLWEYVPEKGEESDQNMRILILKYSGTEYLIHLFAEKEKVRMYFRGYPIKIGNVPCVQIESIGNVYVPLDKDDKDVILETNERPIFDVVSFALANGELTVKELNRDLVDDELKDSEALRKSFLKHKDNKDLFTNPDKLRRIEDHNKR